MSAASILDKNKIRQSFASAAVTYDGFATLQRKVGLELLERFYIANQQDTLIDLGCGTGFITQQLLMQPDIKQIVAIDIALSMINVTREKLIQQKNIQYICADAECLPLANHSVDQIVSNLALQWCQNLEILFTGFNKLLKPQGKLVFSTFGVDTLKELKQAWSEVDKYSHVNSFYSADQLFAILQQSGFHDIQIETKQFQSAYPSVMELMRELKGIGAHSVISGRNKQMTRRKDMHQMFNAYEKFRLDGMIPACYEIIFVSAKAI